MIIIGYPGVGKSWYCKEHNDGIDLESSIINKSDSEWAEKYVEAAKHLSNLGYKVFVSSHSKVQEAIEYDFDCDSENTIAIFPSKTIKDEWLNKLKTRSEESGLDKDKRAYGRALEHFDEDIDSIGSIIGCNKVIIESSDFHLEDINWDDITKYNTLWYPERYDIAEE